MNKNPQYPFVLTQTQKKQCIVHKKEYMISTILSLKRPVHGSYSVTRGRILRGGVPKGFKYYYQWVKVCLNDENNIFLPKYYALFCMGKSNNWKSTYSLKLLNFMTTCYYMKEIFSPEDEFVKDVFIKFRLAFVVRWKRMINIFDIIYAVYSFCSTHNFFAE